MAQGAEFLHLGFHHRGVGTLVFFQFEHQGVVAFDEVHDVGIVKADGGRNDVDGVGRLVDLCQIACL